LFTASFHLLLNFYNSFLLLDLILDHPVVARGKRAMSSRYELIDEDIGTEYEPESWRKETKLQNKPDEVTVEEYIRFFKMNDF